MPDANSSVLTWFLYNLSEVVTSITTMFTSIMSVFMEPPLSIFVGVGIFAFVLGVIGKFLHAKKRR